MWCQFDRWKLVLTSNLKWPEWEKSLYSTLKKNIIQITSSHSRRSPKHWYWKIVEEFRLKFTKFKHVDQLVRDNSSLTLVKGAHLWLKLSKMLYSGMYCLFLFIQSIIFPKQRPQRFFKSRSLELLPAWAAMLDSPWCATRRNRETVTSPQSYVYYIYWVDM